MSRAPHKAAVLKLHALGLAVGDIADRVGCSYSSAYHLIWGEGLAPNVERAARIVPTVWTLATLRDAMHDRYGVDWRRLANRLAWQYGETEALRRVNGYASERVAA